MHYYVIMCQYFLGNILSDKMKKDVESGKVEIKHILYKNIFLYFIINRHAMIYKEDLDLTLFMSLYLRKYLYGTLHYSRFTKSVIYFITSSSFTIINLYLFDMLNK
jgi:hypothetical protein